MKNKIIDSDIQGTEEPYTSKTDLNSENTTFPDSNKHNSSDSNYQEVSHSNLPIKESGFNKFINKFIDKLNSWTTIVPILVLIGTIIMWLSGMHSDVNRLESKSKDDKQAISNNSNKIIDILIKNGKISTTLTFIQKQQDRNTQRIDTIEKSSHDSSKK